MKVRMMAIRCHVMINRILNAIFYSIRIGERLPTSAAAMEFREPNIRYPLFWPELRCVVNASSLLEFASVFGD